MAQPLYRRLHEKHPDLILDVLAPAWSRPLLARMPEVNNIIENPFTHGQLRLYQRWRLGRHLAGNHYDQAIVLPNSLKSALIPFFAGIPRRTGFVGEQRYGLLNDIRRLDAARLPRMVQRFTALAEPAADSPPEHIPPPRLHIDHIQRQQALNKFGLQTQQPIIAFCPGAEYGPAKRWPAPHFAKLAQHLQQKDYQIWLFGSQKDDAAAQQIVRLSGVPLVNLCGKTRLEEAIDLMSVATAVISNDSGLMHVAAALQRPLVALYGSSSPAFTPPLSDLAEIVSLDLSCSPCFERECPLVHFNCMQQMHAELVEAALQKVLQRAPTEEAM